MLITSGKYFSMKNTLIATSRVVFDQQLDTGAQPSLRLTITLTAVIGVQGWEASETEYISNLQLRKTFNLGATLHAMVWIYWEHA